MNSMIASRFFDTLPRLETTLNFRKIGDKGCPELDGTLEMRIKLNFNSAISNS